MGVYRIVSTKDTSITNASSDGFDATRATGSNFGASPVLTVWARKSVLALPELARSLLKFDITELSGKIFSDQTIPTSNVSYVLKLFNMLHDDITPSSYNIVVYPLSCSFDEGLGLDQVSYEDSGYANWINSTSTTTWVLTGSDYLTTYGSASQHFDNGSEDLEVDVTDIVNSWLNGLPNNGFLVKMADTEETNTVDYVFKEFHARETLYIDKLPYLEARWQDVKKDNRDNFSYNVNNNLFMYNIIRGDLVSVQEPVSVRVQDNLIGVSASYSNIFSSAQIQDGVLTSSIFVSNTSSFSCSFYDIWFSGSTVYITGTFKPANTPAQTIDKRNEFNVVISNLKRQYNVDEDARIKVNVTKTNYKTHQRYAVGSSSLWFPQEFMEKMYYSMWNYETGELIIPFGTGSIPFTQLSYDSDGHYFDFSMQNLIPGFMYEIKFLIDFNKEKKIFTDQSFKFKVI